MGEADQPHLANPRWRVRRREYRPWWRRLVDRRLAQADVIAPDGTRYLVRITRNLPLRGSPIPEPLDSLLPDQVSAAILLAANAYTRGRTGWTVKVYRAPTRYRAERFVHKEAVRDPARLVGRAFEIADAIVAGCKPWNEA